ncbi:MAG: adenylyl-sulfate kinase [Mucilaginibacter sp.]|uniref:adenylyl-sulfate kinase n=1 Tax=Mucilaginibacter sp. TaxID=1882438 RepID=UPI0031A9830A
MTYKNIIPVENAICLNDIEGRNGHKAVVVWLTGLSGSGKSAIAANVCSKLFQHHCQVYVLDGDNLRSGLNSDLSFTRKDRNENIRRAGEVAALFYQSGSIVLCSFISPFKTDRDMVKAMFPEDRFIEVYIECSVEECIRRDPKGLYKKALNNEIPDFTGINSPYECPQDAALTINTELNDIDESGDQIMMFLKKKNVIKYDV